MRKRSEMSKEIVFSLLVIVIFSANCLHAQTTFAKYFGGAGTEKAESIVQTSDGGYIVAGYTNSFGAGGYDALILKLNSSGNIQWRRTFGGSQDEFIYKIALTSDSGYVIAGDTKSYGAGNSDALVLKIDSSGNIQWKRTFGGSQNDNAKSIVQTSDGGYIVAGITESYGAGDNDFFILKLNSSANIQWRRTFGNSGENQAVSILQTSDGGYIVAGDSTPGYWHALILKLSSTGQIQWRRRFSPTDLNVFITIGSIIQMSDGSYSVVGYIYDTFSLKGAALMLKLNSSGNLISIRTFAGSLYNSSAKSIAETSDGGSILAGYFSGDEALLVKLNSFFYPTWVSNFAPGYFRSIMQTFDGGYIVAGNTDYSGSDDFLILKLDSEGNVPGCLLDSRQLAITLPELTISAPVITVTAPAISATAPSIIATAAAIAAENVCP